MFLEQKLKTNLDGRDGKLFEIQPSNMLATGNRGFEEVADIKVGT